MNYNWNWGIFFQTSPDGVHTYLETLLLGTGWTLATALSAWCLALAMGSLVGVIRTTPHRWLVRDANSLPACEAAQARASSGSTLPSDSRCRDSPISAWSQPTPTAPGPNCSQWSST